ncbi:MAG: hypothetical protein M4579_005264 [Chaenotheca gracillima]|nr:MAG: hypothetical protein M4579_005264 [Chaenotheca gracillima]
MSAVASSDSTQVPPQAAGSKAKKSGKKKKGNAGKAKSGAEDAKPNGVKDVSTVEPEEDGDVPNSPTATTPQNGASKDANDERELADSRAKDVPETEPPASGAAIHDTHPNTNGSPPATSSTTDGPGTEQRLEQLSRDRDSLKTEVEGLRRSLEEIQEKHDQEISSMQERLDDTQQEKEHAESQYRNLLGKVNTIKSQLGERLKADAEELSQTRSQIEDLEEQNQGLRDRNETIEAELAKLHEEGEQRSKELSSLRNRTNLSQQNWSKEREDLISRETFAKEEFDAAKQAMQDWEVLAMEERSIRENLSERVADLEDQFSNQKEQYERAVAERDNQSVTVDGLHRALQDLQDARKQELRELVESNQAQVEALQKQLQEIEKRSQDSETTLESTRKELERTVPFEKEVKEKNLLIGKLRHEAVILNDHLTKALRFLKKGKPEDNVDRQIVTNYFQQFLALDRADPKKFQVLQIIAALLNWNEEQREQAGLARPGASNNSLRAPLSPFHRTPSTPLLSSEFFPDSSTNKESLGELWSNFLEQEAQEGVKSSRSGSVSSPTARSPPMKSPPMKSPPTIRSPPAQASAPAKPGS